MLTRLAVVSCALALLAPAQAVARAPLDAYEASLRPGQARELVGEGYDVTPQGGTRVGLVLSAPEAARLRRAGVDVRVARTRAGLSAAGLAERQARGGFRVWRSFSEPGGIRDELRALARDHPDTTRLERVGRSVSGQEILALKVTRHARRVPDGARPAVLYLSLQHAREWITVEVNRRLLRHVLEQDGRDPEITRILDTRELWFLLVANPDGYDYTFAAPENRLWRKNLRDNDGDGRVGAADGVDPNRNFPTKWRWDDEGSASDPPDETFRGPRPASEPETRALDGLLRRIRPRFVLNYHSFGPLILYPWGWQVQTAPADEPAFVALAGTDANPGIEGYDPGYGADLYTVNGETDDHAYTAYGTLPFTVELGEGCANCGFVFPDDPALVEAEFRRNVPFALDLARSAPDPAQPRGHLGRPAPALEAEPFPLSYGDPQPVQARARRDLGRVTLLYRVNGGEVRRAPTATWRGGERYGADGDVHYRRVRGSVRGTRPGDRVEAWFEAGGQESKHFTFEAAVESASRVLVLVAEDYTGASPEPRPGPRHLEAYLAALRANGVSADVYDVDARGRRAPHPLGVLGHYDAVVWYTGDDVVTREPGQPAGSGASRLANDEMLAVRDFLNEGGRLLLAGRHAGEQYADAQPYRRVGEPAACAAEDPGCVPLSDDLLQYELGSYVYIPGGGSRPDGAGLWDALGLREPFAGLEWGLERPADAASASHIATSSFLPPARYPQFSSRASVAWRRAGGSPYAPRSGAFQLHSDRGDSAWKRVSRAVDLTGARTGRLEFAMSLDAEVGWDWALVEAHEEGTENWTTLPDANGATTRDTGESCREGWRSLHPWVERYQTEERGPDGAISGCRPTGSSGEWHAATGDSRGWREWSIDLGAYAGKRVEVSISYVSDWGVQKLGAFLDDVRVRIDDREEATGWEDGLGPWRVAGPPPGSPTTDRDWRRIGAAWEEGAGITTSDTILLGMGVEDVAGAEARAAVMGRALAHLLRP